MSGRASGAAAPPGPGPLRLAAALARKDLLLERRDGEVLLVVAPFGAVALLLAPLALGTDTPRLRELGLPLYWLVVLLFGVLVTMRSSAVDGPAQRDLLRLAGAGPRIRLAGRTLANAALLLAFQLLLAPVTVLLYDPAPDGWPWLLPVALLVAVGLAVLGALADALATGLAGRSALGPLLVVPVAVPLLLAATGVLEAARYGRAPGPWLLLVATVDLVAALLAAACAAHLEES